MKRAFRLVTVVVCVVALGVGGFLAYRGGYGNPREDPGSVTGFYIPSDLDDALVELDRILGRRGRNEVLWAETEDEMAVFHFGVGQWMRNNWGLWGNSRLANYFTALGVHHPDDMSGIILDSYWRQTHDQPIDLEGQVRYYKEYWEAAPR